MANNNRRFPNTVERGDVFHTVSTTRDDRSPTVGRVAEFIQDNLLPEITNDYLLINNGSSLDFSFVRQISNSVTIGSESVSSQNTIGVYAQSESRLNVGTGIRTDFFANSVVVAENRIIITNHTLAHAFVTTIDSVDSSTGDIFLDEPLPTGLFNALALTGDGANTVTVAELTSVTIEGDLIVNGSLSGTIDIDAVNNVNGSDADEPDTIRFWTGTETEYQTLVGGNNVESDIIYFRKRN